MADRFTIEHQMKQGSFYSPRWCVFDTDIEGPNIVACFYDDRGTDAEAEARNYAERLADYASQEG